MRYGIATGKGFDNARKRISKLLVARLYSLHVGARKRRANIEIVREWLARGVRCGSHTQLPCIYGHMSASAGAWLISYFAILTTALCRSAGALPPFACSRDKQNSGDPESDG